jgi:hypothetical protein
VGSRGIPQQAGRIRALLLIQGSTMCQKSARTQICSSQETDFRGGDVDDVLATQRPYRGVLQLLVWQSDCFNGSTRAFARFI